MDEIDGMLDDGFDPTAALEPVDLDGDGSPEWQALADDPRVEVHGDEEARFVGVDADSDGDWEAIAQDQTGDGQPDVVMRDRDGDGVLEDVDAQPQRLTFGDGAAE